MKYLVIVILIFSSNLTKGQIITTVAGNGVNADIGDGGPALNASLNVPYGGVFDKKGNYYFVEAGANRVRCLASTGIINTIAGTGAAGYNGDGILATNAQLNTPNWVATDTFGNIYISDQNNLRIRRVDALGIIHTVAGNGGLGYGGDGGPAINTSLSYTSGVGTDDTGNLYVSINGRLLKINTLGIIFTIAGNGTAGYAGDSSLAINAEISIGRGIYVDTVGNLYLEDVNRIRKIDIATHNIYTIAGTGNAIYNGDGIHADSANLTTVGLAWDVVRNLYIADLGNNRVRKIDTLGIIHTFTGNGVAGFSGDGGLADSAAIYDPSGVAFDKCGNLYITSKQNFRIRKVWLTNGISAYPAASVCTGQQATLSAFPQPGCTGATYQWYINGNPYSTDSFFTYTPTDGDSISCVFTCGGNNYTTCNTIKMQVHAYVTPSVSITASPGNSICTGDSVTFTATAINGGPNPTFQWKKNALNIGTGNPFGYHPANNDPIKCIMTSSAQCATVATVTSNVITITTVPPLTPTINITVAPNDTICAGTQATFTATITNGGGNPAYQWVMNGDNAGTNTGSYSYYPNNNDSVRCVLVSSYGCPVPDTVSSNEIVMTVIDTVTPTASITVSPNDTLCAGIPATFNATITNGGNTPTYQWQLNGSNTGTNTNSYNYTPNNNDYIRLLLTTSATCATTDTTGSNVITMDVIATVTPTASITVSPNDTLCVGTQASFSATITNGGNTPTYQWQLNGTNTGTNTNSYNYTPNNNDYIRLLLTADTACATTDTTGSNVITMTVDTLMVPTITLSGPGGQGPGGQVTINATVANAGNSYSIKWYNRGQQFNTTTIPSVTYTKDGYIDTITATILPASPGCYDTATSEQKIVVAYEGVENVNTQGISVYPNPASSYIAITGPVINRVVITNTLGQQVYSQQYTSKGKVSVDISGQPNEVYFIRVNDRWIEKMIKQ